MPTVRPILALELRRRCDLERFAQLEVADGREEVAHLLLVRLDASMAFCEEESGPPMLHGAAVVHHLVAEDLGLPWQC